LKYLAERDEEENYYADAVLSWLSVDPALDLGKTWPQLPVALQENLASKFRPSKPRPWIGPTLSACYSGDRFDLDKASRKLVMAENFLRHYRTIAVPRFIRDSEHRKAILAEIRKLIPKARRDARWLKRTGRMLGTEAEWNVFLFVRASETPNTSFLCACELAAWKFFRTTGVPTYAEVIKTHPDFPTSPKGKPYAEHAYAKQGPHVLNRIGAIKAAILSVYPPFRPFL